MGPVLKMPVFCCEVSGMSRRIDLAMGAQKGEAMTPEHQGSHRSMQGNQGSSLESSKFWPSLACSERPPAASLKV